MIRLERNTMNNEENTSQTHISIDTPDGTIHVSSKSLRNFNWAAKDALQRIASAQEELKALCEAFEQDSGMKAAKAKAWATARFKEGTGATVAKGALYHELDTVLEGA
jgi:hypothetical protein